MALDLAPGVDELAVAEAFARFFERECPADLVRSAEPSGFSADLWDGLCGLGAAGMAVPVDLGGGGASMAALALVAQASGRVLAPVPLVEHAVASEMVPDADVVAGEALATPALHPAIDGTWRLVPAGSVAHVVVGLDGEDMVAVRSEPPGRGPRNHADAPLADRRCVGERTIVGDRETFGAAMSAWKLLTAARLVGLSARALELATTYVSGREQFGRPVGTFQAVQHGLADCVAPVEGASLLAAKAAWAHDTGRAGTNAAHGEFDDAAVLATMAFAFAARTAAAVTNRAVQYHGSYGVSREYDIQLYHRRARGWALLAGDPARQHQQLAEMIWPGGP